MNKLLKFVTDDPFYKLLALVIALALWAYVSSNNNPKEEIIYTGSVEAVNIPSGYNLNMPVSQISVTVKAPRSTISGIRPDAIKLWVDLSGESVDSLVRGKRLQVKYSIDNVNLKKVKVSVNPSWVEVSINRMNSVYMPVNILFSSAPPVGYIYRDKMVSDNTVSVSGSEKEMALVSEIKGEVPAVGDKGFSGRVALKAYSKNGERLKNIVISPSAVTVTVMLDEEISRKYIALEADLTGVPARGYRLKSVTVRPERLLAEGPLLLINDVKVIRTGTVDIGGASRTVRSTVTCRMPSGITPVNGAEAEVICEIEKEK
ncbi:MAG: hypothetical protein IK083_01580 [Abditibacteriota bacterium]|nr:hypothetical protein [Abditibacteriota bacterium]